MTVTLTFLALMGSCLWLLRIAPKYDPSKVAKGRIPNGIPADWSVVRWTPKRKVEAVKTASQD